MFWMEDHSMNKIYRKRANHETAQTEFFVDHIDIGYDRLFSPFANDSE